MIDRADAPLELKAAAWVNLGLLAEAQGEYGPAETLYAAATLSTKAPETHAKALLNLAIVKDKEGRLEEAGAHFREALGLDVTPATRAALLFA